MKMFNTQNVILVPLLTTPLAARCAVQPLPQHARVAVGRSQTPRPAGAGHAIRFGDDPPQDLRRLHSVKGNVWPSPAAAKQPGSGNRARQTAGEHVSVTAETHSVTQVRLGRPNSHATAALTTQVQCSHPLANQHRPPASRFCLPLARGGSK